MGLKKKMVRNGYLLTSDYLYEDDVIRGKKAVKKHKKETLSVDIHGIVLDADLNSINYMSTVVALSNNNCLELMAGGMSAKKAFKTVSETEVPWKTSDNEIKMVTISFIKTAVEEAMNKTAEVVGAK